MDLHMGNGFAVSNGSNLGEDLLLGYLKEPMAIIALVGMFCPRIRLQPQSLPKQANSWNIHTPFFIHECSMPTSNLTPPMQVVCGGKSMLHHYGIHLPLC